jgi:hypothetical protein
MKTQMMKGATRIVGYKQGYEPLPVKDITVANQQGEVMPCMVTAWLPTPDELQLLNAGVPVIVMILGTEHPPIKLTVGGDDAVD